MRAICGFSRQKVIPSYIKTHLRDRCSKRDTRIYEPLHAAVKTLRRVRTVQVPRPFRILGIDDGLTPAWPAGILDGLALQIR